MIYYIETNIIAILVGVILLRQGRMITSKHETSQIIMTWMLRLLILFGVSDIAAFCFRGRSYVGVEIANTVYFICMALGAYIWFLYIMVKVGYSHKLLSTILFTSAPFVLLCFAIFFNPLTEFFFSVDSENLYHRGPGLFVTWIVEWGYMIAAFVLNVRAVLTEQRRFRRRELQGYLFFALPIAAAAACQMLFYGTTTTQIGFMFGILLAHLNMQQYQVHRDELTGLNNRNAFLRYRDYVTGHTTAQDLTVFVIDADRFKSINDVYGHLKGDQALRDIANALKGAVGSFTQNRVLLYRYGGDEFVILGIDLSEDNARLIRDLIHQGLEQCNTRNRDAGEKYSLSVSVGCARRACTGLEDFTALMKEADKDMYRIKRAKNAER